VGLFFKLKYKKGKRRQPKIFHLSDCVEITIKNMPKLSNRIGCNDSPSSLVNQQTESMTEKFFERALSPRLFQLNCGKSRAWGLGTACPARRENAPNITNKNPSVLRTSPFKKGDKICIKKILQTFERRTFLFKN